MSGSYNLIQEKALTVYALSLPDSIKPFRSPVIHVYREGHHCLPEFTIRPDLYPPAWLFGHRLSGAATWPWLAGKAILGLTLKECVHYYIITA